MTLNELLALSDASPELTKDMQNFDFLCHQLCVLTDKENDRYMSISEPPAASMSLKKINLLGVFEERTQHIVEVLKTEAENNIALQTYFIKKIQKLQSKLRVNTSLQLHAISELQHKIVGAEVYESCH